MTQKKLAYLLIACASLRCGSAWCGDGPYAGLEGGANWELGQNFIENDKNYGSGARYKPGFVGGLNGGYAFLNGLRPELELDHRQNGFKELEGTRHGVAGFQRADSAMLNLWYDWKRPQGLFRTVHPYVGGGIGVANVAFRHPALLGMQGNSDSDTVFAYQGGAGVGLDLTPRLTASLDYRYLRTASVGANIDIFDPPFHTPYSSNAAMAGLRYSFGNEPGPEPAAVEVPPPPSPPAAAEPPPQRVVHLQSVSFQFDRVSLTAPARETLDRLVQELQANPDLRVEIDGHADWVGTDAYNMALGLHRAQSVQRFLVDGGVAAQRLSTHSFGEREPASDNLTAEGRARNRRVDFAPVDPPADIRIVVEGPSQDSVRAAQSR